MHISLVLVFVPSLNLVYSPQISRHLSSNSSPKVGRNGGPPRRLRRRPPSAVKPSPMLASGQSKRLPALSSRATMVSLRRAWRLTTRSLPRSPSPSALRTSLSSFSTRSNTRRAVIAVVVISNCSKTASRRAARNFPTRLHGLSCLAPTLLAPAQRLVLGTVHMTCLTLGLGSLYFPS